MKKICAIKTVLAAFLLAEFGITAVQAEDQAKPDVNYSGSYNGMQIIPNEMAIFCRLKGEAVYNDSSTIRSCLNKIIAKMHNSDAQTAKEGKEDWERIRVDQLTVLMGDAAAKTAYDADYEKDKDNLQQQSSQTKTEHEDVAAIAYAITSLTDNVSRLISLTAQNLKYNAIEGLALVDPAVVSDINDEVATENAGTQVTSERESSVSLNEGEVEVHEDVTAVVSSDDD